MNECVMPVSIWDKIRRIFSEGPKPIATEHVASGETLDSLQAKLSVTDLVQPVVTQGTKDITHGIMVISENPADLAKTAGVDLETYSLARCLKSEGYGGRITGKARGIIAVGQCVRNASRRSFPKSQTPIFDKLTFSKYAVANGKYGEQRGRYAATSQDPKPWHILAAKAILAEDVPDLVRGATSFLDPAIWLIGSGEQRGRKLDSFDAILKRWHFSYGLAWTGDIPMVDPLFLMCFKPEPSKQERERSYRICQAVLPTPKG